MALLMVLIERVGAPEATVATRLRTRIFSPALVEFVFVSFPVVFALKTCLTRGAPIDILLAAARGRYLGAVDDRSAASGSKRGPH